MVRGIVVTHGNLGDELLRTARSVFGDFSHCCALSNSAKTPQALFDELAEIADRESSPVMIFVDFMGGSCTHACMRLEQLRDDVSVITGVNLPMLLAFLNKRNEVPFEKLPKEILERSQSSIKIVDPSKL